MSTNEEQDCGRDGHDGYRKGRKGRIMDVGHDVCRKSHDVINNSGVTEMNVFVGLKIKFEKVLSQFPKRRLQQASSVDAQLFKAIQSYAKQ